MSARPRTTLRLLFPQWQGTPPRILHARLPELTRDQASTGHHLGALLLRQLAPPSGTPTAEVPVSLSRHGLDVTGGIHARDVVLTQLKAALRVLEDRDPARVLVLGGDSSVSIGPFAHLVRRYEGDVAVVWVSAAPDLTTPGDDYTGFHAMALATLLGVGDADFTRALPAHLEPERALLVGVRTGSPDALARGRELGIRSLGPADVAQGSDAVVQWLRETGATRVAVHVDLGVLDPEETDTVSAHAPSGLRLDQVLRVVTDVADVAAVVGLTVAEHIPRTEILVRDFLGRLPLR